MNQFDETGKRILQMQTSVAEAAATLGNIRLYEGLPASIVPAATALEQFNQQTGLSMRMLPQEAANVLQVQRNFEKLGNAEQAAARKAEQFAAAQTATREKVMAFSGALSVLQNALGNNLPPAAKKAFNGLSTVASGAMVGGAAG